MAKKDYEAVIGSYKFIPLVSAAAASICNALAVCRHLGGSSALDDLRSTVREVMLRSLTRAVKKAAHPRKFSLHRSTVLGSPLVAAIASRAQGLHLKTDDATTPDAA